MGCSLAKRALDHPKVRWKGSSQGFEAVSGAAAIAAGKIGWELTIATAATRTIAAGAAIAAKAVAIAAFAITVSAIVAGVAAIDA